MKILVVVPAYNEEAVVGRVVREIIDLGYQVVVIDDGSSDRTSQVAQEAGAVVLRHFINCGQGAAIQTGFDYAKSFGADIVVTFDADGQYKVEEIDQIIEPLLLDQVDVVLGSRFLKPKSNIPLIKKMVLKGAIIFERIFVGLDLTDAHNGFRAFSRQTLKLIRLKQKQMAHATEIIEEIKRHQLKYLEVPVTVQYTEYSKRKGQSVFNSIKIIYDLLLSRVLGRK